MCVYKQDMEVQLETTREELLAKFERDKEAILRKFKADMWTEIAKYVAQDGGNQYEPATLQRKYGVYQRQGRIDKNDNYIDWTEKDENERTAKERSKTLMEKNDAEASEGDDEESDVEKQNVEEKVEDDDDDEEDNVDAKGENEYISHGEDQAREDVSSSSMENDGKIGMQENDVLDYGQHQRYFRLHERAVITNRNYFSSQKYDILSIAIFTKPRDLIKCLSNRDWEVI